jgi:hypothetical protein
MPSNGPTIANIRKILAPYIPEGEIRDHARQLREAGLLPAGKAGRSGAGSARLTTRQAALLLISLLCQGPTISVATEAIRVGGFKLRGRSVWTEGRWFTRYLGHPAPPSFLDFMEQAIEIAQGALADREPPTFVVGQGIAFDEAAVRVPKEIGGGMLIFSPDAPGKPRPAVVTERGIAGSIIAEIAALFEPQQQQEVSPALAEWFGNALGLSTPERESAHA